MSAVGFGGAFPGPAPVSRLHSRTPCYVRKRRGSCKACGKKPSSWIAHKGRRSGRRSSLRTSRRSSWKVKVTPALGQIAARDGTARVLEPRVMQVLVALAQAGRRHRHPRRLGWRCWRGTIVGEDAVNRMIALLRRVAEGTGGSFRSRSRGLAIACCNEAGESGGPAAPRRTLWAVCTLLLVAVPAAAFFFWRPAADGPAYSVTVIPFRMTGERSRLRWRAVERTLPRSTCPPPGDTRLILPDRSSDAAR